MPRRSTFIVLICLLVLALSASAALLIGAAAGSSPTVQAADRAARPAAGTGVASAALQVVRRAGARDDLVRLAGETSQTVGTLPARASSAVAAPDGSAVAYLPMKPGPRFWVATPTEM